MEQTLRPGVESGERRLVDEPGHDDAIARRAFGFEGVSQVRRELPEIAHDHQAQVLVALRRGSERPKKAAHVLARVELSDIEHVAVGHGEASARERASLICRRRIEVAVDGLRYDRHALLRHAQPPDHVLLRRLRDGDHRIRAPRERVLPRVPDPRVRKAEVVRRPDEWREIVDGHNGRKVTSRRERKLRRVVDVDPLSAELER